MRHVVAYLTALAFLLAPTMAWADPITVDLHFIPSGKLLTCTDGDEYRCYTFDEWKVLLDVDMRLFSQEQELISVKAALEERKGEAATLREAHAKLIDTTKELTLEVSRVRVENDRLLKENLKLSMPKPWPWIIFVSGLGFACVGLGLTIGSQKK